MIAKLTKGTGFRGALDYLLHGDKRNPRERGNIIATNMAGNTPRELAREFGAFRKLKPSLGKAVFHASISLAPDDPQFSDDEMGYVARRFLNRMGFDDCPFLVVRHTDTRHQHIHVLVSRVNARGKVISDAHDYRRAESVMRELEEMYHVRALPKRERRTKPQLTKGGNIMDNEIKEILDEVLKNVMGVEDFVERLKLQAIQVAFHISGDRICGLTFIRDGNRIKSSTLGRDYGWNVLRNRIFYQDCDLPYVKQFAQAKKTANECALAPMADDKVRRDLARATLEPEFLEKIREHFGADLEHARHEGSRVHMKFIDGTEMIDHGSKLVTSDDNAERAAERMVALALLKGWKDGIQFTGSERFVRAAIKAAIRAGMTVVATSPEQEQMLQEILAECDGGDGRQSSPRYNAGGGSRSSRADA